MTCQCFPIRTSPAPEVHPDEGAVRLVIDGEDRYLSAEDALAFAAEVARVAEAVRETP